MTEETNNIFTPTKKKKGFWWRLRQALCSDTVLKVQIWVFWLFLSFYFVRIWGVGLLFAVAFLSQGVTIADFLGLAWVSSGLVGIFVSWNVLLCLAKKIPITLLVKVLAVYASISLYAFVYIGGWQQVLFSYGFLVLGHFITLIRVLCLPTRVNKLVRLPEDIWKIPEKKSSTEGIIVYGILSIPLLFAIFLWVDWLIKHRAL